MATRTSTPLDAPVAQVTLFEDRAMVTRRGRIQLAAGTHRLAVEPVTPVLSDRSLRVTLAPGAPASARVLDFRAHRQRVESEHMLPDDLAELAAEERRRSRAIRNLHRRMTQRKATRERLGQMRQQLLEEAAEDTGWGRVEPTRWRAELEAIRGRIASIEADLLHQRDGLEDAERELALLRARMQHSAGPDSAMRARIEISLELSEPTALALEIAYLVPGACWRPRYRATLMEDAEPRLLVEQQANVWQHTGEDWADVELVFSTQRPSLGSEPPRLQEDLLQVRPRQEQVVVAVREQQIQTTGLGQRRDQATELPGVDDGGEPVNIAASHPASVPSDGRPYRVDIGRSQASATVDRVVMAELHGAVLLRCTSRNESDQPLLAGPVDLIASSGRVGRGKLGFVAPGERLELGFGPDASLRVFRRAERVEQEPGVLSRWAVTDHHVELKISNLGETPKRLQVLERIPVSEIEQVRVELDQGRSTDGARPDSDGILRWERALEPGATDQLELAYAVKKRSDLVER